MRWWTIGPAANELGTFFFFLLLSYCFLSKRGLCYTFNPGKPGYPLLKQSSAGRNAGLLLQLDVQPEQYYGALNLLEGTGFRMLVHDQNEWPDMENHGIDVSPGFSNTVRIQRHKVMKLTLKQSCLNSRHLTQLQVFNWPSSFGTSNFFSALTSRGCYIISSLLKIYLQFKVVST